MKTKEVGANSDIDKIIKVAKIGASVAAACVDGGASGISVATEEVCDRAMEEAGEDIAANVAGDMLAQSSAPMSNVSFRGMQGLEKIADLQTCENCSYEAMENLAQLQIGDKEGLLNDLSAKFHDFVKAHPKKFNARDRGWWRLWKKDRWYIEPQEYPKLLKEIGIDTELKPFSHLELQKAMVENRSVLMVGDVAHIPEYGKSTGGHALVVVDWNPIDKSYTLLDSNCKVPYKISAENLEKFVRSTEDYTGGMSMVVAKQPAAWPWKTYSAGRRVGDVFKEFENFISQANTTVEKWGGKNISFKGHGDSQLSSLISDANKITNELKELREQAGGINGILERRLKSLNGFKQGLSDIKDRIMNMKSREEVARLRNRLKNEMEVIKAEQHSNELRQEISDFSAAMAENMTVEQYKAALANRLTKLYPERSMAFSDPSGYLTRVDFSGTVSRVCVNGEPVRV